MPYINSDGADVLLDDIRGKDKDGKNIPETFFWEYLADDEPTLEARVSNFFASLTYFILSYIKNIFTGFFSNFLSNLIQRPGPTIFSIVGFFCSVLFIGVFSVLLGIGNFFNIEALLDYISNTYYKGNSLCNWGKPDLMHDHASDFVTGIKEIIDGNPRNPVPVREPNIEAFSIPSAKASLILAAVAYEPWEGFQKLVTSLNTPDLYITQARELHTKNVVSFTRIIFIRDAVSNQNLIFVIFRGTSPFAVSEWLTDTSMTKVTADRFTWGSCHEGFYTKLFLPLNRSSISVYRNILNSIKEMILKDVEVDGNFHPYFVASTGHSLGAAYCHSFHARLLKSAQDLDFTLSATGIPAFQPSVKFIGSYSFGSPRGGNFQHYRSFTSSSRHPLDRGVTLWRVVDANDLIPSVVPGTDDPNTAAITSTNNPQDLLDYTHVGRLVHIHRFRHQAVAPLPSRVGTWKGLFHWLTGDYESSLDYVRDVFTSWMTAFNVPDPVNIACALFPFMGDHAPGNYFVNLDNAIEPKPRASAEELGC